MSNVWKDKIQGPFIIVVSSLGGIVLFISILYCCAPAFRSCFTAIAARLVPKISVSVGATEHKMKPRKPERGHDIEIP
jgi:hypothetical protein